MTIATRLDQPLPPQNLFGICARVGEDFGFDPLWLRLAFAGVLILSPVAVIAAYFALGAVVLTSRVVFPKRIGPRPSKDGDGPALRPVIETAPERAGEQVRLPLAA